MQGPLRSLPCGDLAGCGGRVALGGFFQHTDAAVQIADALGHHIWQILLVQVVIYALYALGSLFTLWAVAVLVLGLQLHGSIPLFLLSYLLVMATMFCIGVLVGGVAANSKSAGIFTSILYFPMLLFSGATLPYEVLPAAAQKIADLLPLTQGIKLLKAALLGLPIKEVWISILVMVVLIVACAVLAIRLFRWE